MLLDAAKSQLLLVDLQARLLPAMAGPDIVARAATVARGALMLGVPVCLSEQYPKGLGPTDPGLRALVPDAPLFAKTSFSALRDAALAEHLAARRKSGRPQLVLAGIEAHVCVLQTALDARSRGYDVFVVRDAVSSRAAANLDAALGRMAQAGVNLVTTEMALFEWLERAGGETFKAVSALIR